MIKISTKQLQQLGACQAGIDWFKTQKKRSLKSLIPLLIKDNHFDYATWLLMCLLTKEQNVLWAIKSAESVLSIFEKQYPNDLRPRKAIEVTKAFLAGKATKEEVFAAANAAAYAANAANAAAYAANAAAYAANAANAAAYAAYAANAAAYAADAATKKIKEIEICNFALELLGEIKRRKNVKTNNISRSRKSKVCK